MTHISLRERRFCCTPNPAKRSAHADGSPLEADAYVTWGARLAHSPSAASTNINHSDLNTDHQSHRLYTWMSHVDGRWGVMSVRVTPGNRGRNGERLHAGEAACSRIPLATPRLPGKYAILRVLRANQRLRNQR